MARPKKNKNALDRNPLEEAKDQPERKSPQLDDNKDHLASPAKKPIKLVEKKGLSGACRFVSRGRCYVEGVMVDEGAQELSLSPAASYRQRNNKNLELIEGVIPTMDEDAPKRPQRGASAEEREQFKAYEDSFIESLDDSTPVISEPSKPRLIKQ